MNTTSALQSIAQEWGVTEAYVFEKGRVFTVENQSMQPQIRPTAKLLGRPVSRQDVAPGLVAVVTSAGHQVGRLATPKAITNKGLRLTFDNAEFFPVQVRWTKVRELYTDFVILSMPVE